jgi:hypothetical protein
VAICADGSAAMPAGYRAKACGRARAERRNAEENNEQQRAHRPGNGSARRAQGTENGRHGSLPVRDNTVARHSASNLDIVVIEIKRFDDGVANDRRSVDSRSFRNRNRGVVWTPVLCCSSGSASFCSSQARNHSFEARPDWPPRSAFLPS